MTQKIADILSEKWDNEIPFSANNTVLRVYKDGGKELMIHGNYIAGFDSKRRAGFDFSCAGWATKTTMTRLNAILNPVGISMFIEKGQLRLSVRTSSNLPEMIKPINANSWYNTEDILDEYSQYLVNIEMENA